MNTFQDYIAEDPLNRAIRAFCDRRPKDNTIAVDIG
jgi:hypothetical protein